MNYTVKREGLFRLQTELSWKHKKIISCSSVSVFQCKKFKESLTFWDAHVPSGRAQSFCYSLRSCSCRTWVRNMREKNIKLWGNGLEGNTWWRWMNSQGIIKVRRIHPLGAIHPIVVGLFQSGPKWWADCQTLPEIKVQKLPKLQHIKVEKTVEHHCLVVANS